MTSYTSVKRDIIINVSPERVWKFLTVPSERNKWETKKCEIDLTVGGNVNFDYGWGVTFSGTIKEIIENRKLVIEGEDQSLTTWEISPQDEGSLVSIEYNGFWAGDLGIMEMENMAFGTYQFLRNFKSVLENNSDIRNTFWVSWIGVLHKTASSKSGVKVVKVVAETPADGKIHVGDVIHALNNKHIKNYDDFETTITELGPDQKVTLKVMRDGKEVVIHLTTVPFGKKISPSASA